MVCSSKLCLLPSITAINFLYSAACVTLRCGNINCVKGAVVNDLCGFDDGFVFWVRVWRPVMRQQGNLPEAIGKWTRVVKYVMARAYVAAAAAFLIACVVLLMEDFYSVRVLLLVKRRQENLQGNKR